MSTRLKATLEEAINDWISEECAEDDWPMAIVAPNINVRMAEAALAVLMANFEGQKYKEKG